VALVEVALAGLVQGNQHLAFKAKPVLAYMQGKMDKTIPVMVAVAVAVAAVGEGVTEDQ
jgi:hypothetical protein